MQIKWMWENSVFGVWNILFMDLFIRVDLRLAKFLTYSKWHFL